jgi:hypothetical protein
MFPCTLPNLTILQISVDNILPMLVLISVSFEDRIFLQFLNSYFWLQVS